MLYSSSLSPHCHFIKYALRISGISTQRRSYAKAADSLAAHIPTLTTTNKRKSSNMKKSGQVLSPVIGTDLPPTEEWRRYFPQNLVSNHRVCVRNPKTADLLAESFVPEGSRDKIIVEAYPGPGQLTRALLRLPKERIRKIIVMEDDNSYLNYLRPLARVDPRISIVELGGYSWDSYKHLESSGLLNDVSIMDWNAGVHPHLQYISQLSLTVAGEQLISQFIRTIPGRQWLFRYGRVPMNFLLSQHLQERVTADIKTHNTRCKLSIIAEAVAECTIPLKHELLQPFSEHFHPVPLIDAESRKSDYRRIGTPYQSLTIVPLQHQIIQKNQLDAWDFCTRRLLVRKATPLKICLPTLAPGAQSILKKISDPKLPLDQRVDIKKTPRALTVNEWSLLVKAFDEWPFRPDDLSIDTYYVSDPDA